MKTIETKGVKTDIIAKRSQELIAGGHEVVLLIQETSPLNGFSKSSMLVSVMTKLT